jgi:hypothetical protein
MTTKKKQRDLDWILFFLVSVPIMIAGAAILIFTNSLIGFVIMIVGICVGFVIIITTDSLLERLKHRKAS